MKIFEVIDEIAEKYKSFWKDICGYETGTNEVKQINELVDFIEKFSLDDGFQVRRIPLENAGDYLIIDANSDAEKTYLFIAHTDTVFQNGAFGNEIVKEEDGKIFAPGANDCKGGIAIALLTMKALMLCGYKNNLRLILVSNEETGTKYGGADIIKREADGYKGCFCCECASKNELAVARKGIMRYRLTVHGKSAHSGGCYFSGVNAIREAAEKIIHLEALSEEGKTTYSCNMISGGTGFNIIPDECSFIVDIRYNNTEEKKILEKNVREISENDYIGGTRTDIELMSNRIPMVRTAEGEELFEKLKYTAEKYGLEQLEPICRGGGSDAAYTVEAGVPTVCETGAYGEHCHTVNEYADIESLWVRSKIIAKTIADN